MRPEIQCETLDAFAGTRRLREDFAAALVEARACRDRLEDVTGGNAIGGSDSTLSRKAR